MTPEKPSFGRKQFMERCVWRTRLRYDGVCSTARDGGSEAGFLSTAADPPSLLPLLRHHCLTLLSIHSSPTTLPFIQGLPPSAAQGSAASSSSGSRQRMDERHWLSALRCYKLSSRLHSSCCPAACPPWAPSIWSVHWSCKSFVLTAAQRNGDVGSKKILKWIQLNSSMNTSRPSLITRARRNEKCSWSWHPSSSTSERNLKFTRRPFFPT